METQLIKTDRGYWQVVWTDQETGKLRREYVHRLIWQMHYGPIPPRYDIHHRDKNKDNNSIENLECQQKSHHISSHNREDKKNPYMWCRKRRR